MPYYIDLSHTITPTIPTWSQESPLQLASEWDYEACTTQTKFRVQNATLTLGSGTHIDAPAHCVPGGRTVDQLTLDELIAPCFVINVPPHDNANFIVTIDHIKDFEQKNDAVFKNSIVLINTGWHTFWANPEKYRNNLQFPTLHESAAQYLVDQGIYGLGIDTLSPDLPGDHYPVHDILLHADKFIIENVAHLGLMPASGATVMVLPIPLTGATEAPTRILGCK